MIRAFFITISFVLSINLSAQNLVLNAGFEAHDAAKAYHQFSESVPNWSRVTAGHPILLSKDFAPSPTQLKQGYDLKKFPPYNGVAHIKLHYGKSTPSQRITAATHIQTKLTRPLKKENIYEIELHVKINETDGILESPQFIEHFGISFSNQPFKRKIGSGMLNDYSPFLLQNQTLNEWIPIKFILRPTIDLEYLVIGAFENFYHPTRFATGSNPCSFEFFVDDISVVEVLNAPEPTKQNAIDFPLFQPPIRSLATAYPKVNEAIYFESGSAELQMEARTNLDKVIANLEPNFSYKIGGHTDNVGSENEQLSLQRAEAVKNYLAENSLLTSEQFSTESFGDSKPIASNSSEEGRQKNRRVTIETDQSNFYKNLLSNTYSAIEKIETDKAIQFLQNLIRIEEFDKITLLHDQKLKPLHAHPKWKAIRFFIKETYKIYEDDVMAFAWEELLFRPNSKEKIHAVTKLLDKHGFPSPVRIGTRAANAPFEILIQNGDRDLIEKYLPKAKQALMKGYIPQIAFDKFAKG